MLDDPISSTANTSGDIVRAHLRDALVLGGVIVAPAGSPVQIRAIRVARAQSGDYYGFVDIAFLPMRLSNGEDLPLRTPTSHLTPYVSTGHEATVGVEDTVADIIFPLHTLYQAFRKGRNVMLGPGSILRARTVASVSLEAGVAVVATPTPLEFPVDVPAASYRALPFAPLPTPVPKPTRSPTPSPEPSPTSTLSAAASPLPSPT